MATSRAEGEVVGDCNRSGCHVRGDGGADGGSAGKSTQAGMLTQIRGQSRSDDAAPITTTCLLTHPFKPITPADRASPYADR